MSKASETLGYARGLLKAMEATCEDKNLLEVMNALVDALDEHNANIRKLDEQFSELDEYVESIDDDLAELEDMVDSIEDGDYDDEDGFFFGGAKNDPMDFDDVDEDEDEDDVRPLRLVKHGHKCKCGHHHHDQDHECHCHDDEDDCDCDCDDEDADEELDLDGFDNLFLGVMCPECNRLFCVTDADFDDPEALYHCPYCEKDVHISPIAPDSVPVAKRVK